MGLPHCHLAQLQLGWNSLGGGVTHLAWACLGLGPSALLHHLDLSGTDLDRQVCTARVQYMCVPDDTREVEVLSMFPS